MSIKQLTAIPNPPAAPAGQYAEWDGTKWVLKKIPEPTYIPQRPSVPDGYFAEWDGKQWNIKISEKIAEPTELEKAKNYLQNTAWLFIDGIIDTFPNAAEIKAARLAAIEILKANKGEYTVSSKF